MKNIRAIHLDLDCFFAPMLLFFAVSGIWQTLGLQRSSHLLEPLSSVHETFHLKTSDDFSGPFLTVFVLLMVVSFIFSVILGVVMALKHGGCKRTAI